MSVEENKAIVRRMYEEIHSKGNLAAIDEVTAAEFVDHNAPPGVPAGPEGVKQTLTMYRTAFPDMQATVEDMVAEGDKVVARLTVRGTHKGELMGVPPYRQAGYHRGDRHRPHRRRQARGALGTGGHAGHDATARRYPTARVGGRVAP